MPLFSTSKDILEGLAVGSIFLAMFHVHESGYKGRRPKGNSFIKISHHFPQTNAHIPFPHGVEGITQPQPLVFQLPLLGTVLLPCKTEHLSYYLLIEPIFFLLRSSNADFYFQSSVLSLSSLEIDGAQTPSIGWEASMGTAGRNYSSIGHDICPNNLL